MEGEILPKVLDSLRTRVSDFNFKNWFKNLAWKYEEPNQVMITVPSKFIRDWLSEHYLELIRFELFRCTGREHKIQFKVEKHVNKNLDLFASPNLDLFPAASAGASPAAVGADLPPMQKSDGVSPSSPSPVNLVNKFIRHADRRKPNAGAPAEAMLVPRTHFNPKYSFEHFVVGNSNQFVHAACKAVALQPAKSYNPLFIYGGVGLGKTHLLSAIGLEVQKNYPKLRVVYATGEHFTNELINAIRDEKTYDLRKKYRDNCDMLLIDDIQFIAGKERTMEEFFHTFNTLYENRKQIIMTSDQYPKNIDRLEERLKSRFSWGLLADIQSPDFETRCAILRKKAAEDGVQLPADVCHYIASNITSNVRDLEGALVRVCAFASLAKLPINIDVSQEVLKEILIPAKPDLSIEAIQNTVAEFYKIKISDLKSKRRHKNLAVPRQIAMYLCKKHLVVSFPQIGTKFGGKDHTTVIHAVEKIKRVLGSDHVIQSDVNELEKFMGCAA